MTTLRSIWRAWKKIGQFMGDWMARIVLTVFYFTIFLPFGIGVRLFGDPLNLKPGQKAAWRTRTTRDHTLADGRRLS